MLQRGGWRFTLASKMPPWLPIRFTPSKSGGLAEHQDKMPQFFWAAWLTADLLADGAGKSVLRLRYQPRVDPAAKWHRSFPARS